MNEKRLRVLHVITGLNVGGAELMLSRFLTWTTAPDMDHRVVSLTCLGSIGGQLRARGVSVDVLGISGGLSALVGFRNLIKLIRRERSQVIQTWMYHADALGGGAGFLTGTPVVWGIHNSTLSPDVTPWFARALVRLLAGLSHVIPKKIVSCSEKAREVHVRKGYEETKMVLIPNGFDTNVFKPNREIQETLRRSLGLPDDAILVGHVARFHSQKDHENFVRAAGGVAAKNKNVWFALFGGGTDNPLLKEWVRTYGVAGRCFFMGLKPDMENYYPALDVLVSSSRYGEAFPLVVGEAMATEIPCVVTDVGDSARLVGDTGDVVPPGDPARLAEALEKVCREDATGRKERGARARKRVLEFFGARLFVERYESLYRTVGDVTCAE